MKSKLKDLALKVAGVIFLVMSVAQLLRYVFHVRISAGNVIIPVPVSLVAFIVLILLAIWMFKASK